MLKCVPLDHAHSIAGQNLRACTMMCVLDVKIIYAQALKPRTFHCGENVIVILHVNGYIIWA